MNVEMPPCIIVNEKTKKHKTDIRILNHTNI